MSTTQRVDYAGSPVIKRGRTFEEQVVGEVVDHAWERTVTEADNTVFTTATLGFEPRYFSVPYAQRLGLRREQVNPMLVFSMVFGLSVEHLSEIGGPFLGGEDLVFGAPVFPGDTLRAHSTVVEARESSSRPSVGVVTWETVGTNQDGREVIRYRRSNLVARGPVPNAIDPVEGYVDDFAPGMTFRHARSKTISDIDLALLTPLVMNSASGHFSEHLMADTEFGQRINFGGQTLSLVVGLTFQDTTAQLVREIGLTAIRFEHPVVRGDTISAHTEVLSVIEHDLCSSDVVFRHVGLNQHGDVVCRVDRTARLRRRHSRADGSASTDQ